MTIQQPVQNNPHTSKPVSRRAFLRYLAAGLALASSGPLVYASFIEPNNIEVVEQTVAIPGLGPGLEGLRVAQISDLHAGLWLGNEQLTRMANRVLAQKPELVLITGDFMTAGGDYQQAASDLISSLRLLTDALPVMAVRGNHDHGRREATLTDVLAKTGVVELNNAVQSIQRGGNLLYIAGIDSVSTGHQGLHLMGDSIPTDAPVILMAHEPDMADYSAPTGKFALQLSGHSHGGQVVLPFLGRMVLPWMGRKYPEGLYQVGSMQLYTNRGIGTIHIPLRLNCSPEITILTLTGG